MKISNILMLAAIALVLASPVSAASGEKIFRAKCKICHSLVEGKNKMGPSLYNLFGRKAGTVPKYRYSKALKNSGIIWEEETLDKWLAGSRKVVKKTKMRIRGLKQKDRAAVILYLIRLQGDVRER